MFNRLRVSKRLVYNHKNIISYGKIGKQFRCITQSPKLTPEKPKTSPPIQGKSTKKTLLQLFLLGGAGYVAYQGIINYGIDTIDEEEESKEQVPLVNKSVEVNKEEHQEESNEVKKVENEEEEKEEKEEHSEKKEEVEETAKEVVQETIKEGVHEEKAKEEEETKAEEKKEEKAEEEEEDETEEIHEDHTHQNPEKQKILNEIKTLSPTELRNRIAEMTLQMKVMAKEEALTLLQSMKSMDGEANKINAQLLRDQAAIYEELLERKLRLQKEKLADEQQAALRRMAKEFEKKAEKKIEDNKKMNENELERALEKAEKDLKAEFLEKLNKKAVEYDEIVEDEREKHSQAIEQMTLQLEAIRKVLSTASANEGYSHQIHRLSASLLVLSNNLESPEKFIKELKMLKSIGENDPLVEAVYGTLPKTIVNESSPLVTMEELRTRYKLVEKYGRQAALVGENPSFNARILAVFTSYLLFRPTAPLEGEDAEAILSRASYYVDQCDLNSAVNELSKLPPAAAGVAEDWIRDAKNRAVIEQGLRVLGAYGALLASSCS